MYLLRVFGLLCLTAYSWGLLPGPPSGTGSTYRKYEFKIPMRDGKRLFTAVYVPRKVAASYPILLSRTPYGIRPYGLNNYPNVLGPSRKFDEEGFIFAFQDVRGRYMSEGEWVEMRPMLPAKAGPAEIDESTDSYDTIEWLLKNVPNNNGKVGLLGVSYSGFYTTAGLIDAHPALAAASPQAPIADLYRGDDAYHNGAFFLAANFSFYRGFAKQDKPELPPKNENQFEYGTQDGYEFFMRMGAIAHSQKYFKQRNPYWTDLISHTTYDDFWKARNILPHLHAIKPAVLIAGGWFDAEDLSGTLNTYAAIGQQSPNTKISLAMGPWSHGQWQENAGRRLGDIDFGSNTSEFFQNKIALPFFVHYLKGTEELLLPPVYVFETGKNEWKREETWPPADSRRMRFYLRSGRQLSAAGPAEASAFDEYVSDPRKPVPFVENPGINVPAQYMDADQRFAESRADVLTYTTAPLEDDLTVAGPIAPVLYVSTGGSDSDFVVKVIDAYPKQSGGALSGYEQLIRGEPFRGKFRGGFETPRPFTPGEIQKISFVMPDIYHCFRRGHRLMVQIQSSWFPLVDRNPQTFTEIPTARKTDFRKATERIYRSRERGSCIDLLVER